MTNILEIAYGATSVCRSKYTRYNAPPWYQKSNKMYVSTPIDEYNTGRHVIPVYSTALFKALPDGAICAGSYLTQIFDQTIKCNDIDIFFQTGSAFMNTLQTILRMSNDIDSPFYGYSAIRQDIDDIELVDNIHVINIDSKFDSLRPSIQLIKLFYFEEPSDVIDSFDMTMVQVAATNQHILYNPMSFLDIKDKRIVFNKLHGPLHTMRRLLKYTTRGYKLDDASIIELLKEIQSAKGVSELDQEAEYE